MRLEGKVAIVTGGGSGIGLASARALAAEGAHVVVSDVDPAAAADAAAELSDGGPEAVGMTADVTDADAVEQLVAGTVERFGALHVVHANAGVALVGQDVFTGEMDPAIWRKVIDINLTGVFHAARFALPAMRESGGGSFVATASSQGVLPLGANDAYAASKAGVMALVASMSPAAARWGVRVNAICPGYVDTPLTSVIWSSDEVRKAFELGHADGLQTPEEIAEVVVFLASDDSRSFTGASLTCDRGWTAFKQPDLIRGLL